MTVGRVPIGEIGTTQEPSGFSAFLYHLLLGFDVRDQFLQGYKISFNIIRQRHGDIVCGWIIM